MDDDAIASDKPVLADIQADIDRKMFAQSPVHIIERFLANFSSEGTLTIPVPEHVLEALASKLRVFFDPDSPVSSLDDAFGGHTARQRQALLAADRQFEVAFGLIAEMARLHELSSAERGAGTPYEIACENLAARFGMSVSNVQRIYKEAGASRSKAPR